MITNEMAEKLHEGNQKLSVTLPEDFDNDTDSDELWELKTILARMKSIGKQAETMIQKYDSKVK